MREGRWSSGEGQGQQERPSSVQITVTRRHTATVLNVSSILLANWELSGESRKARGPHAGKRGPFEPADEAEEIGRQSREEVLEMRLADAMRVPS
jgi:hypothetical protein